jgi:hypothetical protein
MSKNLKGVHVWWTKPAMKNKVSYYMPDYQLITLILSALYWKKNYGEIVLYTDKRMVDFLKRTGIYDLHLWDEINTEIIENVPDIINPNIYWAGAKLFVAKELEPPFVLLDVDAYFKKHYEFDYNMDLMYFHLEDMTYPHYPQPKLFIDQYPKIDMNIPQFATNVAVLFINNKKLLEEYTYHAIEFMMNPNHNIIKQYDTFSVRIIFIEQVLLSILLNNNQYKSKPIIKDIFVTLHEAEQIFVRNMQNESNLYSEVLDKIEHIWGDKHSIENKAKSYFNFMAEHTRKLKEFPNAYNVFLNARKIIDEIDDINNYRKKFNL